MKKLILLTLIVFAFIFSFAKIWINEFIVTPTSAEYIELYNDSSAAVDVLNYTLTASGTAHTFKSKTVPAMGYASFNIGTSDFNDSFTLSNAGTALIIHNASAAPVDSVSYGTYGPAPAPIYNFSCARVNYNAGSPDDAVDFNMDFTPTMGSANDCPANALGSGNVFFSEVRADSAKDTVTAIVEFVELYNNSNVQTSIANWIIVSCGGDDYTIPAATDIPAYGFYVLYDNMVSGTAPFFYFDPKSVMYLYNNTGARIDQVGWDYTIANESFAAQPTGDRAYFKGYNVATSTDFVFGAPTPGALNGIEMSKDKSVGYKGDIEISSVYGVGIKIDNTAGEKGSLAIIDASGRTIYTSSIKNMIFDTRAGVYFVKIDAEKGSIVKRIEIVK